MYVQFNRDECQLLAQLVDSRIREIHPEIRHSREFKFKEQLKHELEALQQLQHRLHEAEIDISA